MPGEEPSGAAAKWKGALQKMKPQYGGANHRGGKQEHWRWALDQIESQMQKQVSEAY